MMKIFMMAVLAICSLCAGAQGIIGVGNRAVYSAATPSIAFDNASGVTATNSLLTNSYSFTVGSGTNRILFVGVVVQSGNTSTPTVTYGGTAMTVAASSTWNGALATDFIFVLPNPASGANTVSITLTGATPSHIFSSAASYTGAAQTTTPDSSNSGSGSTTTSSLTTTTVADNSWTLMWVVAGNSHTFTAGAGTTLRTAGTPNAALLDSNAAIHPAGSSMLTATGSTTGAYGALIISFAP
jgi:hypothetical protein